MALLEHQSNYNSLLKVHLEKGDHRTKYTSNKIQTNLLTYDEIKSKIVQSCNNAPFFKFMADEATDVSTMEQMALCLRYFDPVSKSVVEHFIGFAECTSTTGEALFEAFHL